MEIKCDLRRLMRVWQADRNQNLTFADLAKRTGKGERTLRRWAGDNVSSYDRDVLAAICVFFEVGIEAVLVAENGKG